MTQHVRPDRIGPLQIAREDLVRKAEDLHRRYARAVGADVARIGTSFDALYDEVIYPDYGICLNESLDLGVDTDGKKILGLYDPEENTAYIDVSLNWQMRHSRGNNIARRTFTCWHEVAGHGVLQGAWLRKEMQRLRAGGAKLVTTAESMDSGTTILLERQANLFASHAGAPTELLRQVLVETYGLDRPIRYLGPSSYSLSVNGTTCYYDIGSFDELCRVVARNVKHRFGFMSSESLGYRVATMPDIVKDETAKRFRLQRVA